jgi:plasmid stabilization system protein ParE
MTFRVVLQRLASADVAEAYEWAASRAPDEASKWVSRLEKTLGTLAEHPDQCPLARESSKVAIEVRELLFGRRPYVFRVLYVIDGDVVRILRILRAQQRFLTKSQIEEALKPDHLE